MALFPLKIVDNIEFCYYIKCIISDFVVLGKMGYILGFPYQQQRFLGQVDKEGWLGRKSAQLADL